MGVIEGLAAACEWLDHKFVNRMLFDNNGIDGDHLATLLEGALKMEDFKALIIRRNLVNNAMIDKLGPVLQRRVPHHLEEL